METPPARIPVWSESESPVNVAPRRRRMAVASPNNATQAARAARRLFMEEDEVQTRVEEERPNVWTNVQPTPFHATLFDWETNVGADTVVDKECLALLQEVDPEVMSLGRKIRKVCQALKYEPWTMESGVIPPRPVSLKSFAIQSDALVDSFLARMRKEDWRLLRHDVASMSLRYNQGPAMGEGVTRNILNDVVAALCAEFLVPMVDGSEVHTVRADLDVGQRGVRERLALMGWLLGVALFDAKKEVSFPVRLHRGLIYMCLYYTHPEEDFSYFVYHLLENMRDGVNTWEQFKYVMANVTRVDELEEIIELTGDMAADMKRWFQAYLRNVVVPRGSDYVAMGFGTLSGMAAEARARGVTVQQMVQHVCAPHVSDAVWESFVQGVQFRSDVPVGVQDAFRQMLRTMDPPLRRQVLYFWGASYYPMKGVIYQVATGHMVATKKICPLTASHTCYTQLEIPRITTDGVNAIPMAEWEDYLKRSLQKAMEFTGSAMTTEG